MTIYETIEILKQSAQSKPNEREISYTLAMQPIWEAQDAIEVINFLQEENKKLKKEVDQQQMEIENLYQQLEIA